MILLPAIDLMGGEVVRLKRGLASEKTVYSSDPVAFAKKWEESGADWLHLVDLDAAFSGQPRNLAAIEKICAAVDIPCELGGGMRNADNVSAAFSAGVSRVILGTKACESPEYVAEMCREFGGDRIAVGIDAKDGRVAVKGWTETTQTSATDLALTVQKAGAGTIIYTDIATDGMLEGPNFGELEKMLQLLDCQLIASGGVSSADDLRKLAVMPGLYGAIIGKALYDGRISGNLRELIPHAG
ncbi:MAG: 1-(5-phosphoribosyl)-5-[(5-phosphoribosylamino)methylideneamino]imidazole-4-carboxamide isomerase [Terrimicrobiaceae bacterium]|nr:1-(5-phosphoribosyl)-5-[(5-phosphoribosylamino)methylideneamino]imidazole-4-carboxamide isomerase [Terrimicrobiaceae bacterium]